MNFKHLLLFGAFALTCSQAMADIVGGVRVKPTYPTQGFVADQEVYLINVGTQQFFTQGNNWCTQASVGDVPRKVRFALENGAYTLQCYCWRGASEKDMNGRVGGYLSEGWRYVFFSSESSMFVDGGSSSEHFFDVTPNGQTFRLSTASSDLNPTYGDYASQGLYVGLPNNSSTTALSPFVTESEACVDWAIVTEDGYNGLADAMAIYEKAQQLKALIDQIKEKGGDASAFEEVYLNEASTLDELKAACLAAKDALNGENVTHYIINAGFDADLTFNVDGTMKEAVSTTTSLSDRSWAYIAADNTVYARPKSSSSKQRTDGRNKEDAVNGFHGQVQGWTLEGPAFPNCEWMYFGTVPYGLPTDAVLIADDGNGTLIVPEKPEEFDTDDNVGMLYMRAGWTNKCVYKQEVKLPCAKYHLEYWTINVNPNSTASAKDMSQITCRKDVFKDEEGTGLSSTQWVKHEFEFTPTSKFTIQFGYESANTTSNNNPWICLDGIRLYKIGEADPIPLLKGDILDYIDELAELATQAEELGLAGVKEQINAINTATYTDLVDTSNDQNKLQEASDYLQGIVNAARAAIEAAPRIAALIEQIDQLIDGVTTKGAENLKAVRDEVYAEVYVTGDGATVVAAEAKLTNGILYYNNGVTLYNAIAALSETIAQTVKANASLLSGANEELTASTTLYESGVITDADRDTHVNELNRFNAAIAASAEAYASLAAAIADLEGAVTVKANADILNSANSLLSSSKKGYNDGSVDDDAIEGIIISMNDAIDDLNASAAMYQQLADATPALEAAVAKKAMQSLLDEANTLLTEVKTGYADGSIADDDIETLIESMNAKVAAINASATEYAKLKAAIDRLAAAIEEASAETEHVAASTLMKANLRLTASQKLYDEGTIADSDIDARIATIDQLITELTGSINLYKDFVAAIDNLKAAIDGVEGKKLAAATLEAANTLYTTADAAYKEGTIDDDQVAAQINTLNAMINTLNSSVAGYAELNAALEELAGEIEEAVANGVADELINQATGIKDEYQGKYDAGSIADADMAGAVARVKGMTAELEADIERILTAVKARMAAAENQGDTYTVGGQKVVGKQKGLVIRNGRKVVVK